MGIIFLFKLSTKSLCSNKTHFLKEYLFLKKEILIFILYLNARSVEAICLATSY